MFGPSRGRVRREGDNKLQKKESIKSGTRTKIINRILPHDNLELRKFSSTTFSPALSGIELEVVGKEEHNDKAYHKPTFSSIRKIGAKASSRAKSSAPPARIMSGGKTQASKSRKLVIYNNDMPKHSKSYKLKRATRYVNEEDNYLVYKENTQSAASSSKENSNKREQRTIRSDASRQDERRNGLDEEYENVGPKRAFYENQLKQEAYEYNRRLRIPFSTTEPTQSVPIPKKPPQRTPTTTSYPEYRARMYNSDNTHNFHQSRSQAYEQLPPSIFNSMYVHPGQNMYPSPPANYYQSRNPHQPPVMPQMMLPMQNYPSLDFGYRSQQVSNMPYSFPMNGYGFTNRKPIIPTDYPMLPQLFPLYDPSKMGKPNQLYPQPQIAPTYPYPAVYNSGDRSPRIENQQPPPPPVKKTIYNPNPYVYNVQAHNSPPADPAPPPPRLPHSKYNHSPAHPPAEHHDTIQPDKISNYADLQPRSCTTPDYHQTRQISSGHTKYYPSDLHYFRYDVDDRSSKHTGSERRKQSTGIVDQHTFSYQNHSVSEWDEHGSSRPKEKPLDQYENYTRKIDEAFRYSGNQGRVLHDTTTSPRDMYGGMNSHYPNPAVYDHNFNVPPTQLRDWNPYHETNS